jgi:hypothetical protein
MSVPFRNYSRHLPADVAWIEREVTDHLSIVDGMEFVRRIRGGHAIPTVLAQDEYTHDATLEVREDLFLVYSMT